jgi:UDP-N-acetylmuramate: L-alanyl-gamma-D-glutamyl-meso-diaminopimelate ligase
MGIFNEVNVFLMKAFFMNVHFIAIGGSAMHNLAIALHKKGYRVCGSDDEIFEPAKSRLSGYGLLPEREGWDPDKITGKLDAVILGMHARGDNPELIRAKELNLRIYSYPEFLYEQSKTKKRIVIGGSHGKTTITAMILHVLRDCGIDCDYLVGAQLEGFDVMVRITDEAPIMVFEGDEYLTSPIDPRPKFHLYKPDIALLSGIAWDHINVFPTFESYVEQFILFIGQISKNGTLIYCSEDETLRKICPQSGEGINLIAYSVPDYRIDKGLTIIRYGETDFPLQIFGKHNLLNLNGARLVCNQIGIEDHRFYQAITSFRGASKRLERIAGNEKIIVFKDFAHAPSKVKATLQAVREQFPDRKITSCLELHTYSSLSKGFLNHYKGVLDEADHAIVYYSHHAIQLKRLPAITPDEVKAGFANDGIEVFTDSQLLLEHLLRENWSKSVLLMMSSGNFDGIDLKSLAEQLSR